MGLIITESKFPKKVQIFRIQKFISSLGKEDGFGYSQDMFYSLQIQPNHPLDETSIAWILRDLLYAIEYLHNEGKIHRDIKGT